MYLATRAVMTTLVALAFLLSGVGVAAAHTSLVGSDPVNGATVASPLTAVVLNFSEEINPAFADVAVTSADGRNWVSGSASVEGTRLTVALGPDRLTDGLYTVGYRVVSADGHPVSGSYSFTIAGVGEQPSPTVAPSPAAPSTDEPSVPAPGSDTKASVLTAAGVGLALGGVIAFWQHRRRRKNAANHPGSEPGPSLGS
ncbi:MULTISPECIES: copper resistance CopC family protein [Mycolicibacterium]|uniref:Copper resistance protein C n=2 Tax=Mycolicibacterium TaxID=1866885 RepID=A0A6N4VJY1_9MYCO|nr:MULTISPECIES: copper resistance CopC family protein [Mycolicibacterium]MCG7583454.1 copper resistance protein CopC [Mycolicibacterium sp. OfavD-34-C]BBX54523.1 copper resistance protein C [Mycolicibacterium poriferae]GFG99626.1 copper resistance protein C [Mycolicibacterium hippocampi]